MDSDLVSEARSMSERDASRGRSNEDTTTLPQPSRVTSASVLARTSPTQRLSLRRRARTVSGKWRYERAQRAALGLARSLPDIRGNTMVSDDGIPLNVDSWTDTRSEGSIVETEVVVASLSSEEVPSSFFDKVTRFISRLLWSAPVELQTDRAEAEVSAQEEHIIGSDELTFEFMVDDEKDDEMLPPTPREWWWHAMLQYVKPMDVINLLLTTTSAFPSSSLSIVRLANLVLCAVAFVATWKWSDRCLRSNWAK